MGALYVEPYSYGQEEGGSDYGRQVKMAAYLKLGSEETGR